MAEIDFQDATITTPITKLNLQRLSLSMRQRVFDKTKAGDGRGNKFSKGNYFWVGALVGYGEQGWDPDDIFEGTLSVKYAGTGGSIETWDVIFENVTEVGSFITGGLLVITAQWRGEKTTS